MNNHIYSTLFKKQERESYRRSKEIEQRKVFLTNFLKNLHNLLYQNPCLINLSVSSLCLMTKLWNVSHILLILMSCEMYTPYVEFAGILLYRRTKVNYVKIKGISFVIDLINIFTTTYTN